MVINTECIHISDDFFHDFGITVSKATEVLLNTDFGGHFFYSLVTNSECKRISDDLSISGE